MKIDRSILQANNQEIGEFGDPNKLESSISHVADIVDSNDNDVSALKTDNTSNKSRLSTLETDNTSNKSRIATNESNIAYDEARLDNLLRNTQQASEVVDARRKANGTVFPILGDRLNDVDSSLVQKANQTDVNDALALKSDKTYVDAELVKKANQTDLISKADKSYVDNQIANVVGGSPKGVYATLSALQTAYPTGNTNIYVVLSDGNWYYWNGTAWTSGGVYQSSNAQDGVFQVTNIITNGDFSNGTTGWNNLSSAFNVVSGQAKFTSSASAGRIYKNISMIQNHKYYMSADVTSDSTLVSMHIDGVGKVYHPGTGVKKLSNLFLWDTSSGSWAFRVNDERTSAWTEVTVDNALLIDLTAIFGSGYEPSKTDFETMLSKFPNSWFDGTANLFSAKSTVTDVMSLKGKTSGYDTDLTDLKLKDINEKVSFSLGLVPSITKNTDKTITVTFQATYMYNPKKIGTTDNKTIQLSAVSYTLAHNDILLWNLTTNTLVKGQVSSTDKSNSIILLFNTQGEIPYGALLPVYFSQYKKDIDSLKTDVNNLKSNGASISLPHTSISTLLNSTITRAKTVQTKDTFSFLNITDIHETPSNQYQQQETVVNAVKATNMLDIKCLTLNGDIQEGDATTMTKALSLSELQKTVYNIKSQVDVPVLIGKGNHDDNLWDGTYNMNNYGILPADWHNYCVKPFEDKLVLDQSNKTGNYFYTDFDDYKIRIVMLNSLDVPYIAKPDGTPTYWAMWNYSFQNAQINWFAHTALNFSDKVDNDWGVIVLFHNPIRQEMCFSGDTVPNNANIIEGILKAFNTHTSYIGSNTGDFACDVNVDFTGDTSELICVINGHTHFDRVMKLDGITYIDQLNSVCKQSTESPTTRTMGTDSQEAFDIYTIDRTNRVIYDTRHGAGGDRVINY